LAGFFAAYKIACTMADFSPTTNSDSVLSRLAEGRRLLSLARTYEALEIFREVLGLSDVDENCRFLGILGTGFAYAFLGDLSKARDAANRAGAQNPLASPQPGSVYRLVAEILWLQGRTEEAAEYFREALVHLRDDEALEAKLNLAAVLAASEDFKAAQKILTEAVKQAVAPGPGVHLLLLLRRGEILSQEDNSDFEKGVLLSRERESPYFSWVFSYALGSRLAQADKLAKAQECYTEALGFFRQVWTGLPLELRGSFLSTGLRKTFCTAVVETAASADDKEGVGFREVRREVLDPGPEKDVERFDSIISRISEPRLASMLTGIRDRYRSLLRLQEVNKAINAELDLNTLLSLIIDKAVDIAAAERGFLMLRQDGRLRFQVARNIDQENIRKPEFKISHSIAEEVSVTGKSILTANASTDPRFSMHHSVYNLKLSSVLCVPMKVADSVTGILYIDNRFREALFGPEIASLLELFASQAAVAIENARLYQENIKSQKQVQKLNTDLQSANEKLRETLDEQNQEIIAIRSGRDTEAEETWRYDYSSLVGTSPPMRKLFRLLDRIIETEIPVLIEGASGTGKELVARVLHGQGTRHSRPFLSENCGALTDTLLESELFGHVKGAFTGATGDKKGLFEAAHRGTLFLDEVSEMSAQMQKKLLRVLQEGELRPVGGKEVRKVDVRILSASNKNLRNEVQEARFREDLFYRLNVLTVTLPPLRDRREDIPALLQHFWGDSADLDDIIDAAALDILYAYGWPGNVRELKNLVTRTRALGIAAITVDDLPAEMIDAPESGGTGTLDEIEARFFHRVIRDALNRSGGNKTRAAQLLGIPKTSLYNRMKKYGIDTEDSTCS
jgi:transcriptional regulator with GAF, ATPase, and Fis domain